MTELTPENLADLVQALSLAKETSQPTSDTLAHIAELIRPVITEHSDVELDLDNDWEIPHNPEAMNQGEMLSVPRRSFGYALDKLEGALQGMHSVYAWLKYVPDDTPRPPTAPEDFSVKNDALASPLEGTFHYALKSYLALVGKLTLANENDLAPQQLSKDPRDFEQWLKWVGQDWGNS